MSSCSFIRIKANTILGGRYARARARRRQGRGQEHQDPGGLIISFVSVLLLYLNSKRKKNHHNLGGMITGDACTGFLFGHWLRVHCRCL